MLTGLGIVLGIVLVVIAAIYGIVKLVLGFLGFVGGNIANGFDKVRRK